MNTKATEGLKRFQALSPIEQAKIVLANAIEASEKLNKPNRFGNNLEPFQRDKIKDDIRKVRIHEVAIDKLKADITKRLGNIAAIRQKAVDATEKLSAAMARLERVSDPNYVPAPKPLTKAEKLAKARAEMANVAYGLNSQSIHANKGVANRANPPKETAPTMMELLEQRAKAEKAKARLDAQIDQLERAA